MERKEDQRLALIKAEELRENVLSALLIIGFLLLCLVSGGGYLWHLGFIKF